MEFSELIKERRSIRCFSGAPDHETLAAVLKEAQQAPSWKNMQTSRCYVAESPEVLEALHEKGLPPFNNKSSANAALIVTAFVPDEVGFSDGSPVNEMGNHWGAYDLGLHDAYLVLAAKNAGLDTLIMGIRNADGIREVLNIPENEQIGAVIAIGYRNQEPADRPRKPLDEVVKFF